MKIALIGNSYHWNYYRAILDQVPGAEIVAVAPGSAEEPLERFDDAQGVTDQTKRFADGTKLLDAVKPDLVQISTSFTALGPMCLLAAQRGVPFMAEKPIAQSLEMLERIWEAAENHDVPVYPMQGMMGSAAFAAAKEAVAAGLIGKPGASYHQKSYRKGTRPDSWKNRETFPGIIPWVGTHALAWMQWILGECFTEVAGWEGGEVHPGFKACALQAGLVFRGEDGAFAQLSIDFLRPEKAPTHGDERLRIAGPKGVVEVVEVEKRCTLITQVEGPRDLKPSRPVVDPVVQFARAVAGEGDVPVPRRDGFRVTEIALKAQQAAENGARVALRPSPYVKAGDA